MYAFIACKRAAWIFFKTSPFVLKERKSLGMETTYRCTVYMSNKV